MESGLKLESKRDLAVEGGPAKCWDNPQWGGLPPSLVQYRSLGRQDL